MRRNLKQFAFLLAALTCVSLIAAAAQACPMCSQSIAEEEQLPRAFMYSILFMLGMPAAVFAGLGSMIYLKFRKFGALPRVGIAGDNLVPLPVPVVAHPLRDLASRA